MRVWTKFPIVVVLAVVAFAALRLLSEREPAVPASVPASVPLPGASVIATVPEPMSGDTGFANVAANEDEVNSAARPDAIAGILELRTDFAQTRAAFELAAASDIPELEALIAEAQGVASGNDRIALTAILMQRYAEIDPAAGARFVVQSTLEAKRELIFMVFNSWSRFELDASIAGITDLDAAADRRVAAQGILAAMLDSDVGALGDIAERLAASGVRDAVPANLVARVAAVDLEAALRMADTIGNDRTREAALENVLTIWAETDAAAAMAALEVLEIDGSPELLGKLGKALAKQSPAEALDWVRGTQDSLALMTVMAEIARENPGYMLDVLRRDYTPVQQQHQVEQILQRMAIDDPAAAIAFWTQVPAEFRPTGARSIVGTWAQRDPLGAEAWVLDLPQQAERQQALRTLLIMLSNSDDAARFAQLVEMLDSAEDRDTHGLNRVATLARNGDPEAAERQLNLISLSPDYYRRAREAIDEAAR